MYVPQWVHNFPQIAFGPAERDKTAITRNKTIVTPRMTIHHGNGSSIMLPHSHLVRDHRSSAPPRPL
jgi:hypothetical protein